MSDLNKFSKLVDDIWELVFGTKRTPKQKKDIGQYIGLKKPKRSRGKKGRYLADDPTTAFTNEAWVGGKAPKRGKK
jgi:hypothetical protein